MDVARTIGNLTAVGGVDFARGAHVARGLARAFALTAHTRTLARFVFPNPPLAATKAEEAELYRRLVALFDDDFQHVRDGLYPASLANDFSWRTLARVYPRIVADAPRMRRRAHENRFDDVPPEAGDYPRYYRRTFHFQTEGYLSEHSAALYDTQVELLFGGTAQVMRRQALPPLVEALRGRERARTRVLDLACGTGNVLRMLAAALPGLSLFGVDLSPHYIAHARRRLDDVVPLSLVVENAESLPFVDGYFDAVVNVFLMHELPPKVRSRVLSEVARVLAPGGRFVLADSVQRVDAPAIARLLENFPKQFHEPFYRQYLGDDLLGRFAQAGLVVDDVRQAFLTKIVVAHRPAAS